MAEVIHSNGEESSSKTDFDNVAIVLKPIKPQTSATLWGLGARGEPLVFLKPWLKRK
jgi:hypothetical protein